MDHVPWSQVSDINKFHGSHRTERPTADNDYNNNSSNNNYDENNHDINNNINNNDVD